MAFASKMTGFEKQLAKITMDREARESVMALVGKVFSRKSKSSSAGPKRPPNAYIQFMTENRAEIMGSMIADYSGDDEDYKPSAAEVTKEAARLWKAMEPDTKSRWVEKQREALEAFKAEHPDHVVISYINCSAAIKAQSDLICTSSNAVAMVQSVPSDQPILFAPDQNLGRWVSRQAGRELTLWPGSCMVHETFSEEALLGLKAAHPDAAVIAHPECEQHLLDLADFIGSTSKLLNYSQSSEASGFIVLTEPGILHQMRKAVPNKEFYAEIGRASCRERV